MEVLERSPFLPGYILCEMRADPTRLAALIAEAPPPGQIQTHVLSPIQIQIDAAAAADRMRPTPARTLVVAMISLLIFPHAASHMIEIVAEPGPEGTLARWRRHDLADLLLCGFAPRPCDA